LTKSHSINKCAALSAPLNLSFWKQPNSCRIHSSYLLPITLAAYCCCARTAPTFLGAALVLSPAASFQCAEGEFLERQTRFYLHAPST
jgi:hypothetical protein